MKFLRRKNSIGAAALACLLILAGALFAGCGMGVRSASTSLTIDETGKLLEEIVESQGNDDFTAEELKSYIDQQIGLYNQSREGAVKLNTCSVQNGEVKISMEYASCEDYAAFNQVTCFAGTLQEAEDAGYEVDRTWLEPNGARGDMQIIRERFKEWKVFIVSEQIDVKAPDKILYASDNVEITGRLTASVQSVMDDGSAESVETAVPADTTGAGNTTASGGDAGGQAGSTQTAGTPAVKAQTTIHPLATVADKFAYIIYK